ncbi:hypothetical protein ACH5RR_027088 [Cinchona calisaya]|uniref:ZCF37 n=1 Tax=Cinchona calisaya TaxID=153742 RepID=A0ABD2Z4G9_9GENT
MCSPFSCGSFKNQERDDFEELLSPCTIPRRSRSSRNHRDSKNPYANQGLERFYALLAQLEDKKKKIYIQKGSERISFIYFTNSNSDDWKPVIVKLKKKEITDTKYNAQHKHKHTIEAAPSSIVVDQVGQPKEEMIIRRLSKTKSKNWSHHIFGYLPVTIILILLFLAMYGRSFAILCTTFGWYLVPMTMKEKSSSSDRPKKKNEHVRRLSQRNMVNDEASASSPTGVLSGQAEKPSGLHAI